jgi:hypothetical protein
MDCFSTKHANKKPGFGDLIFVQALVPTRKKTAERSNFIIKVKKLFTEFRRKKTVDQWRTGRSWQTVRHSQCIEAYGRRSHQGKKPCTHF